MTQVLALLIFFTTTWAQATSPNYSQTNSKARLYCPKAKAYLQQDLNALTYPNLTLASATDRSSSLNATLLQLGPLANPLIKPECVEAALASVTAGAKKKTKELFRSNRFIRCGPDQKPIDHQDEPCRSSEYKSLMHASFELTTKCLKEFVTGSQDENIQNTWVEGYFKMLSTESGLHVNVASKIGAIGVGQLRGKYIADFKLRTLSKLKKFLAQPGTSDECKRLSDQLLTTEKIEKLYRTIETTDPETDLVSVSQTVNTCANININEDQPLLNIIISFSNLKVYKDSIVDSIFTHSKYRDAFKDLSQADLLDLEIKMVSWSYNLGPARLKSHLMEVLGTKYSNKTITDVRQFIVDADLEGKRNYVFGIEDRYKKVLAGKSSCRTDIHSK